MTLKLIFRKNKSCHELMTTQWDTVTFVFLKPLKQLLINVTSFRLLKLLYS